METPLRKTFYFSASLHAAVMLLLLVSPYLPFKPYRPRHEKVTWINLPKGLGDNLTSGLKKAADLPKTTIQEQKKPLEAVKPPPKPTMTYEKKQPTTKKGAEPKKKSEAELQMEKALSRAQQQVTARKAAVPEAAQVPDSPSGGIPEGTSTGPIVPPDDPERLLYQLKIRQDVVAEWIPPLKFQDPSLGLICRLIVRINERGEVLETKWDQKSGNEAFDLSASRAINKASPLPPPPERLKWEAIHEGILFEFNPALLSSVPR